MRRLVLLAALLVGGCSLPLPGGVHDVGDVPQEQRVGDPLLQVIPPGPRKGAPPTDTVLGFLGAQASSEDRHAVAREFLAPPRDRSWSDTAGVLLYDPTRLEVSQLPGSTSTQAVVRLRSVVLGEVSTRGAYAPLPESVVTEDYTLERVRGEWRISGVADGLRLSIADRDRALRAVTVHYLVPATGPAPRHVVADPVFLPVGPDFATNLVNRQLQPPSRSLASGVLTAVPAGARLARPVSLTTAGVATVDVTGLRGPLSEQQVRDLSAQLTWTLRSLPEFTGLRLQVDGTRVRGPGIDEVQDAGRWDSYDPEGLGRNPPYFYVEARRLRSSLDLPPSPATQGAATDRGAVPVDGVAVSPDRNQVALVQGRASGPVTVRLGALSGRSFRVVAQGFLSSPGWGSGGYGLWMVRNASEVVRLSSKGVEDVTVVGMPSGRLQGLAMARDGVRACLVVDGRLYVGRVSVVRGVPRIVDVTSLVPALGQVKQASWQSGTQLVVLGSLTRSGQLVRVAVDGSSVVVLPTPGLVPTAVSAIPTAVLSVAEGRLYLSSGGAFDVVEERAAEAPAFPG